MSVKENLEIAGDNMSEVLSLFPELKSKLPQRAGTLSGGQQQMLALARGLMTNPKILLLDEPSLGLMPRLVKQVFQKIKEINQKRKIAMLIVEHNIKSLLNISDRVYILDKGKIVSTNPKDYAVYLLAN